MAVRTNPNLIDDLERFGARDVAKCYQCGNCTAACTHSDNSHMLPRKPIRYLQVGLEKPLRSALEPWLCYYCGECSEQCPRGAEPGETMMGIRRWLTAQYDFTGISKLLYRSWEAELAAILALALLTGVGFFSFGFLRGGGNLSVYDGPGAFLPAHDIHIFDWTMGAILGVLLAINCLRMWFFTMRSEQALPVSLSLYVRHLFTVPLHFFTQKSFRDCNHKRPWITHFVLMLSYLTMLILIMLFLKDMLLVTGPVTRNMADAVKATYEAVPTPKLVVAVGACGCSGGIFAGSHAVVGAVDALIPVDGYIPGCPPTPSMLVTGILEVLRAARAK